MTISLKDAVKKRILVDSLKSVQTPGTWKVLLVDEHVLRVMNSVCDVHDLADVNVPVTETLSARKRTRYPDKEAIYLISPTKESVEFLVKDFSGSKPMYAAAHIFCIAALPDALFDYIKTSNVRKYIQALKEINIDFLPFESQVFHFDDISAFLKTHDRSDFGEVDKYLDSVADRMKSVLSTMEDSPVIRYFDPTGSRDTLSAHLAFKVHDAIAEMKELDPTWPPESAYPQTELIIVDRTADPLIPLLHSLTYQAALHDLLQMDGSTVTYTKDESVGIQTAIVDEADSVFNEVRDLFVADAWKKILQAKNDLDDSTSDSETSLDSLKKIDALKEKLLGLPQAQKRFEKVALHIHLYAEIMQNVNERKIGDLANIQQTIATGEDPDGTKRPPTLLQHLEQILEDPNYLVEDKLRTLLTFILGSAGADRRHLVEVGQLMAEIPTLRGLDYIGAVPGEIDPLNPQWRYTDVGRRALRQKSRKRTSTSEEEQPYDIHRYVPALKYILQDAIAGELDPQMFPTTDANTNPAAMDDEGSTGASQEKQIGRGTLISFSGEFQPMWASRKPPTGADVNVDLRANGSRIIVLFVDGVTFPELRVAREVMSTSQREVYIGSPGLLTPSVFVSSLRELGSLPTPPTKMPVVMHKNLLAQKPVDGLRRSSRITGPAKRASVASPGAITAPPPESEAILQQQRLEEKPLPALALPSERTAVPVQAPARVSELVPVQRSIAPNPQLVQPNVSSEKREASDSKPRNSIDSPSDGSRRSSSQSFQASIPTAKDESFDHNARRSIDSGSDGSRRSSAQFVQPSIPQQQSRRSIDVQSDGSPRGAEVRAPTPTTQGEQQAGSRRTSEALAPAPEQQAASLEITASQDSSTPLARLPGREGGNAGAPTRSLFHNRRPSRPAPGETSAPMQRQHSGPAPGLSAPVSPPRRESNGHMNVGSGVPLQQGRRGSDATGMPQAEQQRDAQGVVPPAYPYTAQQTRPIDMAVPASRPVPQPDSAPASTYPSLSQPQQAVQSQRPVSAGNRPAAVVPEIISPQSVYTPPMYVPPTTQIGVPPPRNKSRGQPIVPPPSLVQRPGANISPPKPDPNRQSLGAQGRPLDGAQRPPAPLTSAKPETSRPTQAASQRPSSAANQSNERPHPSTSRQSLEERQPIPQYPAAPRSDSPEDPDMKAAIAASLAELAKEREMERLRYEELAAARAGQGQTYAVAGEKRQYHQQQQQQQQQQHQHQQQQQPQHHQHQHVHFPAANSSPASQSPTPYGTFAPSTAPHQAYPQYQPPQHPPAPSHPSTGYTAPSHSGPYTNAHISPQIPHSSPHPSTAPAPIPFSSRPLYRQGAYRQASRPGQSDMPSDASYGRDYATSPSMGLSPPAPTYLAPYTQPSSDSIQSPAYYPAHTFSSAPAYQGHQMQYHQGQYHQGQGNRSPPRQANGPPPGAFQGGGQQHPGQERPR
ncbi:Sec1-like protein [Fimicolochytrium jonesii]|uniref:Sec1-like protein n=1 Tax=Fimicolochytrium jonesii TaxID=1396493 RepID=UPI0022FE769C|nr:Sec1-like protein [Fimicolochytrium jonesii]KAI8822199.1 Sec1-like protein [Fimicolochytrium jonesii]